MLFLRASVEDLVPNLPNPGVVSFTLKDMTGTPGLVPLTHGHLLYTAWALGLVTTLAPEEVLLRVLSHFFQGWLAAGS